jgi:hypothetical protein
LPVKSGSVIRTRTGSVVRRESVPGVKQIPEITSH